MKIKLISNPTKQWAKELSKEAKILLRANNHHIVRSNAQATICIGGDGTILYAHHKNKLEGNILGIGSKTSYICQLRNDNWKENILRILEKNETISVMTLVADVDGKRIDAINDIVIHSSNYRVITISVEHNGEKHDFEGDGIVVCSPIGSAAYAYSAGGEKISILERKIGVVGICPYMKKFIPTILDEKSRVDITPSKSALIADGILISHIKPNTKITVQKGRDIIFYRQIHNHD